MREKPPLVVGNWKMHGTQRDAWALAQKIRRRLKEVRHAEVVLAPPFTSLHAVYEAISGSRIRLAGQNLFWEREGAFTGEVSPEMLRDAGCTFVLIGHSERRRLFNEGDEVLLKKVLASLRARLRPILCVGETLEERDKGWTARVVARQLQAALKGIPKSAIGKVEIAYEPVWAIGTGHNATPDQVRRAHCWIREVLERLWGKNGAVASRILYGGSVRPDNAGELVRTPEVNGLLVGGASLRAEDFLSIIHHFGPV